MRRLAIVTVLLILPTLQALIVRLTSLQDMLNEANFVLALTVESLDEKRPSMTLAISETLKGKATIKKMPVLLQGDKRAMKLKETPQLLKRLAEKQSLVAFVKQTGDSYAAFVYANGTWFSLTGVTVDSEVRWSFTHLETYLRRTYKGSTGDLAVIVKDAVAGKRKPPGPDEKEKPGIGPEVKLEK